MSVPLQRCPPQRLRLFGGCSTDEVPEGAPPWLRALSGCSIEVAGGSGTVDE
ncbi:MAG TPA: hypothetical protein VHV82_02970 [Sporichthyaceae bacterium]|nr:hypothetical protein [Sporichthyaceae bacterium]